MTAVTVRLGGDPRSGSSATLHYDNVTFLATNVVLSCGPLALYPLIFAYDIGAGWVTLQCDIARAIANYTFPAPIQGVQAPDAYGGTGITWFVRIFYGHGAVPPSAVIVP